jgi:hypothetical protein
MGSFSLFSVHIMVTVIYSFNFGMNLRRNIPVTNGKD